MLGGVLLDAYPGAEGYRYYYLAIAGLCALGTASAWLIYRRTTARVPVATPEPSGA